MPWESKLYDGKMRGNINMSTFLQKKENIEISISHSRMNAVAVCIIKEAE